MQTIQLQIEDDIYDELKSKGIDINHKLQHFLYDLLDDGYPAISEDEAKQRVSNAVDSAYRDWETDRKSTRLNSSHITRSRMPSSA